MWRWNRTLRPACDREKIMASLWNVENNIPFLLLGFSFFFHSRDKRWGTWCLLLEPVVTESSVMGSPNWSCVPLSISEKWFVTAVELASPEIELREGKSEGGMASDDHSYNQSNLELLWLVTCPESYPRRGTLLLIISTIKSSWFTNPLLPKHQWLALYKTENEDSPCPEVLTT